MSRRDDSYRDRDYRDRDRDHRDDDYDDRRYRPPVMPMMSSFNDSPVERELRHARRYRNPLTSRLFAMEQRAQARSLAAVAKTNEERQKATDTGIEVMKSTATLRRMSLALQAQDQVAHLEYQAALENRMMAIETGRLASRQRMIEAERAVQNAETGLEADARFKDLNLQLGRVRKQARVAETIDILPEDGPTESTDGSGMTLGEALRYRNNLQTDSIPEPAWLTEFLEKHDTQNASRRDLKIVRD